MSLEPTWPLTGLERGEGGKEESTGGLSFLFLLLFLVEGERGEKGGAEAREEEKGAERKGNIKKNREVERCRGAEVGEVKRGKRSTEVER